MVQGRGFTAAEEATVGGATPVIVDVTLAERLFANENPVGQLLQYGADSGTADSRPMVIVGLAPRRNTLCSGTGPRRISMCHPGQPIPPACSSTRGRPHRRRAIPS